MTSLIFDEYFRAAVAATQKVIERQARMGDKRNIVRGFRPFGQHGKPIFCSEHIGGQQFALGQQILDREDKVIVAIPDLVRQQSAPGAEVLQCRSVRR